MAKNNTSVTYSPYNRKFYQGSWDKDDTDFSRDYGMTVIAKLNPELKMGDGRIEPINYEMFRQAERDFKSGNIDATSLGNITVIELLEQVIRKEWRDFNAIQAVRRIPVPKLQLKQIKRVIHLLKPNFVCGRTLFRYTNQQNLK